MEKSRYYITTERYFLRYDDWFLTDQALLLMENDAQQQTAPIIGEKQQYPCKQVIQAMGYQFVSDDLLVTSLYDPSSLFTQKALIT